MNNLDDYNQISTIKESSYLIPTRDTDMQSIKSNGSSTSSLGILSLDNFDVQNSFEVKNNENSINRSDKLENERLLAQKAMERFDLISKSKVGGLPSYLLKPSQPTPGRNNSLSTGSLATNESNFSFSDLEKSYPKMSDASDKFSFKPKEISARSSLIQREQDDKDTINTTENLTDVPPLIKSISDEYDAKYQELFDRMRKSDIAVAAMCDRNSKLGYHSEPLDELSLPNLSADINNSSTNSSIWYTEMQDSLVARLQNELFTPAELAAKKLLSDELSWRKANETMPPATTDNNHLNLSCFSGYIEGGDISLSEFFKLRSENVNDLNLKTSPKKSHNPCPLINDSLLSSITSNTNDNNDNDNNDDDDDDGGIVITEISQSEKSIFSVSKIADVISNMNINDTPDRVIDMLAANKKKIPVKPPRASLNQQNTLSTLVASSVGGGDSLKENRLSKRSPSPRSNASNINRNNNNINNINNSVLRDTTNLPSPTPLNNNNSLLVMNTNGDWVDAVTPNAIIPISPTITESPSRTCSELEFSEDERRPPSSYSQRPTDIITDEIISIELSNGNSNVVQAYLHVEQSIDLTIRGKSQHWTHVTMAVERVTSDNFTEKVANVQILNGEAMFKLLDESEQMCLKIKPLVAENIEIIVKFEVVDVTVKLQKIMFYTLHLKVDKPKICFQDKVVDFDLNAECSVRECSTILINKCPIDLPVELNIVQNVLNNECIYMFASGKNFNESKTIEPEFSQLLTLPASGCCKIPIDMCCPRLEDLNPSNTEKISQFNAVLRVSLADAEPSSKCLANILLTGKIGITKIQFKSSCLPFILKSGEKKAIPVRNSGEVPLSLAVSLHDETTAKYFTLECNKFEINPTEIKPFNVTFICNQHPDHDSQNGGVIRNSVKFEYLRGLCFTIPIEGNLDSNYNVVMSSTNRRHSQTQKIRVHSPAVSGRSSSPIICRSPRTTSRATSSGTGRSGSSQSIESGSSLASLHDGKLPIETTKTELVWGCVRPGKSNVQEFVLRNRSAHRIRLQTNIEGSGYFQFVKDHTENVTNQTLLLHGKESRTITVNFTPPTIGATKATLLFLPVDPHKVPHTEKQKIYLFGYGGYTSIDVQKVAKDTTGRMWLSFGRLNFGREILQQQFILRNVGSIPAFACLSVACKVLYPFMDSSVNIFPSVLVIEPNREAVVTVKFKPRPEDFKYIQRNTNAGIEVTEIASIKILTGPEATRGRIRRLHNKICALNKKNGNSINNGSVVTSGSMPTNNLVLSSDFLVPRLSETFPDEKIPGDIALNCRESCSAMRDLLRDIDTRDLILTIERDAECVGNDLENQVDETCMFQSLVCGNSTINDTTMQGGSAGRLSGGFCSVEPRKVILTPPTEPKGTVLLRSHHSRPMQFEISMEQQVIDAGIQVTPQVGVLDPSDMALLTITATKPLVTMSRTPSVFTFKIYVENEVMEIEVKVFHINQTPILVSTQNRRYK